MDVSEYEKFSDKEKWNLTYNLSKSISLAIAAYITKTTKDERMPTSVVISALAMAMAVGLVELPKEDRQEEISTMIAFLREVTDTEVH